MEIQLWVLTGLVSVMTAIITMVVRSSLKRLVDSLDEFKKTVQELVVNVSVHKTEIENQTDKNNEQDRRINDLSGRLREIEIKK